MIAVSTLAVAIKKELGSYFSTDAHKDSDIVRYINSAARAIATARNFDFNQYKYTLVVTTGTTTYSIPYQIETFYVKKDGSDVCFHNFIDYNALDDKTQDIGIWGDTAEVLTPGTYDIYYRGFPDTITTLSDVLELPEHFYDLVLLEATYFGFMDIRAYDKASIKKAIFDGMIKDMATRSSNPAPLKVTRLNTDKNKSNIW